MAMNEEEKKKFLARMNKGRRAAGLAPLKPAKKSAGKPAKKSAGKPAGKPAKKSAAKAKIAAGTKPVYVVTKCVDGGQCRAVSKHRKRDTALKAAKKIRAKAKAGTVIAVEKRDGMSAAKSAGGVTGKTIPPRKSAGALTSKESRQLATVVKDVAALKVNDKVQDSRLNKVEKRVDVLDNWVKGRR